MPISNLNNVHLSAEQVAQAQTALSQLEQILAVVNVNLTPDERQRYGSVNEQNKLFINKVRDYYVSQPTLSASEVEWNEFNADYQSRSNYEGIMARLYNLVDRLNNAKTLHDYDNYQSALTDYAFTAYKAGSNAAGYEAKLNDLKQFFSKTSKPGAANPPA
ncbi:hypothetical protein U0035_11545 [Niabella yanshanensis]|uniref:Uncharacterized protein n=1 Tax=Niabella yanshanensis TaxID=577386 RepID=A0ABZ0W1D5_9BACT|nr:hypothetical protein [Niabella yanshanensis]WQD36297.1 hypothetical protein U0035_11545 [Niabella yanshanensis]